MSNSENVRPDSASGNGGDGGAPLARSVARELRKLAARPPPGVQLLPQGDDLTLVLATIDGPAETPYQGGVFRVRLALGARFPAEPPRATFLTRLFHPNVAADSGEVCVTTLARDWRPDTGLEHALLALRCLLIAPNPESALNAEAAALLRDDYHQYAQRARLLTEIHARPAPAPAPAHHAGPGAKRARGPPQPHPALDPPKDTKERRRILKRL